MAEKASSGQLDVQILKGETDSIYKEIVQHAGEKRVEEVIGEGLDGNHKLKWSRG